VDNTQRKGVSVSSEKVREVATLEGITRIRVPADILRSVHTHLRDSGASGFEGVGFWAGRTEGETFFVEAAVVPTQWGHRSSDGVAVMISGDELHRMNVWLHRNRFTIIAQLHSHPGDAYHSETDDEFSIMTRVGGLSIVVPNFAKDPFSFQTAAFYRLLKNGDWRCLDAEEASDLIHVESEIRK
jgi:proteasome lid subunit RPN8/RPN11